MGHAHAQSRHLEAAHGLAELHDDVEVLDLDRGLGFRADLGHVAHDLVSLPRFSYDEASPALRMAAWAYLTAFMVDVCRLLDERSAVTDAG